MFIPILGFVRAIAIAILLTSCGGIIGYILGFTYTGSLARNTWSLITNVSCDLQNIGALIGFIIGTIKGLLSFDEVIKEIGKHD